MTTKDPKQHAVTVSDLAAKPALSFSDACLLVGLPSSTMSMLDKQGIGPKWFFLGRRKFVGRATFLAWLAEREAKGAKK